MSTTSNMRRQVRRPLTGDLTGRICSVASGSVIPCMAVDISANGMRIMLTLDLEPGTELDLKVDGGEMRLVVVWCMKEATKKGYFSCGLATVKPEDNLETMFKI